MTSWRIPHKPQNGMSAIVLNLFSELIVSLGETIRAIRNQQFEFHLKTLIKEITVLKYMQSDLTASIQDTIGARCTTEMRFRLGCGSVDWWGVPM